MFDRFCGMVGIAPFTVPVRQVLRPVVRLAREVPLWPVLLRRSGRGRRLVALPAMGAEDGAAGLRIYLLAALLRSRGWQVLVLPPALTLTQRHRLIAAFAPDGLLMQGVRHPLNRPHLYPGLPVAMDMDDADFHLPHLAQALEEAMPRTDLLIAGSRCIADWGRAAGAPRAEVVWTGTPVSARPRTDPALRPPVVAWAQTRPMTYTREAELVRRVMADVGHRRPGVTLRLYDRCPGDDPAFADSFAAPGVSVEWRERVSYDAYLASFDDVAVGLAPLCPETPFSRGKSFGKVLAYLDRKVPVIGSDEGEHGAFFTADTGVITNDGAVWRREILSLLGSPERRSRQAEAAFASFLAGLEADVSAERLDAVLRQVIAPDSGGCSLDFAG